MNVADITADIRFQYWLRKVDQAVYARAGCSVHDLPDWQSRDSFDNGDTPLEGAQIALVGADFYKEE